MFRSPWSFAGKRAVSFLAVAAIVACAEPVTSPSAVNIPATSGDFDRSSVSSELALSASTEGFEKLETRVISNAVAGPDLITNGSFESFANPTSITGWTVFNSGSGWFYSQAGTSSPISGFAVPAPTLGSRAAMSDQTGPGTHMIYQKLTIPAGGAEVSFDLTINNRYGSFITQPNAISHSGTTIQQFRADIVDANFHIATTTPSVNVLQNLYLTQPGDVAITPYTRITRTVPAALAGKVVYLRFLTMETQFFFQAGIDNVTMFALTASDATPPVVTPIVTGTLGTGGWYTSDVNVSWTATDAESAITSPACTASSVTTDTNGATFSCTATSLGGTTTNSVIIKRDASVPTVTPTVTGTLGTGDWYTSDVGISWAVTANGPSGATSTCVASTQSTDTPGQNYDCTATSGAGKTGTNAVTVKRDASIPTVTPTVAGTVGSDGWYTSDVAVNWSATGNGPSGATESCAASTLAVDTNGQTYDCTATSGAGLTASNSVAVKRDASAPTVTPTVSGTLGSNGWYTSDVNVSWSAIGNGPSGALASCVASTLSTNTDGQTYDCAATSGAGIATSGSVTVRRDTSIPSVTPTVGGTLGSNGWYTSDVMIGWSAIGNGPSSATSDCVVSTLSTDTDGQSYDCSVTSGAGLSASSSVTVKRDASLPTITSTVSGTLGSNGWYTSDVGISWGVSPNGPSSATSSCVASTLSGDSNGTTYDCSAATGAGLTASNSVTVKRDATTPGITATIAGDLGNNGWYTSNVSVSWSVSSSVSGAVSGCAVSTLSSDSNGTTFDCSATSGAGLSATKSVSVKRDATKPVIGYSGNAGSYTVDQNVSIGCSASDAMSGLASSTCANIAGSASSFGAGSHSYSASASDIAGNTNGASTSFTVVATSGSLCALVRQWVTGPGAAGVANSLCVKLEKGNYAPFINEVQAESGKKISTVHANILIAWAQTLL